MFLTKVVEKPKYTCYDEYSFLCDSTKESKCVNPNIIWYFKKLSSQN
jgi:hypothetical protein